MTVGIIKEETYRSGSKVNVSDDMVRVTLTCSINTWRKLRRDIIMSIDPPIEEQEDAQEIGGIRNGKGK